jgi:type IV pilus assembly protein PilB
MRLGELLLANGMVKPEQMDRVISIQQQTKKKLGEVLISEGILSEKQLAEVLKFQLGFPVVHLFDLSIDLHAVHFIQESVARKYLLIPFAIEGQKLKCAMADPLNYDAMEEVRLITGLQVEPFIATKSEIELTITKLYAGKEQKSVGVAEQKPSERDDLSTEFDTNPDSPIVKFVNQMILNAVQQRASDIHVEAQEKQVIVRYRVDGALRTEKTLAKDMQDVLISRLKIISKLNIAEKRLPQDGRIQISVEQRKVDIRISTLPSIYGESVVLRVLDQSIGIKDLHELGFADQNLQTFERALKRPNGMILISGPTGSGKTSTLYSAMQKVNREDVKIITVEDPVEYRMQGVTQMQVNHQIGLSFASGLRSILRQDPNIVMIGEIRDVETAEIAVRASLTGHLVLSTIHTNNSISTISRLLDMGIESYLLASSVVCVLSQRLVRRVCPNCRSYTPLKPDEIEVFRHQGLLADLEQASRKYFAKGEDHYQVRGKGCAKCYMTGFFGRIAINEVLLVDDAVRAMIARQRPLDEMRRHLEQSSFQSMMTDGLLKVIQGMTTLDEVMKVIFED